MHITEPQFRQLLDRYLNGTASPQETKMLDEFFETYRTEHPDESLSALDPGHRDEILKRIHERLEPETVPFLSRGGVWWKVAAAFAVVVMSVIFISRNLPEKQNTPVLSMHSESTIRGQKAEFQLPDGTRVHLNSNSSLHYPQHFASGVREVTLQGEAYFEVVHDPARPFVVRTGAVATRVLGTSFNVRQARNHTLQITLVAGKVKVDALAGSAELQPGEQAVVDSAAVTVSTRKVDVNRFVGWKNNTLYFEQDKLSDAAELLGDWYDVDITVAPALRHCRITATYQDESLENVLKSFQFLLNAQVDRKKKRAIVITGKGCK